MRTNKIKWRKAMRITIDGSPEEIKNLLDAIGGSKEQISYKDIKKLFKHVNGIS